MGARPRALELLIGNKKWIGWIDWFDGRWRELRDWIELNERLKRWLGALIALEGSFGFLASSFGQCQIPVRGRPVRAFAQVDRYENAHIEVQGRIHIHDPDGAKVSGHRCHYAGLSENKTLG